MGVKVGVLEHCPSPGSCDCRQAVLDPAAIEERNEKGGGKGKGAEWVKATVRIVGVLRGRGACVCLSLAPDACRARSPARIVGRQGRAKSDSEPISQRYLD